MDGERRYAEIREQIAREHEIARLERLARPARIRLESRKADRGWTSGVAAVVGAMTRIGRRAFTA